MIRKCKKSLIVVVIAACVIIMNTVCVFAYSPCSLPIRLRTAVRPVYLFSGECRKNGWILKSLHQRHQKDAQRYILLVL